MALLQLADNLYCFRDTCNVYVVRSGRAATVIDWGTGDVLDVLPSIGVARVDDVLITHHHRDQVQGLARAAAAGARIWVPHAEQDLIQNVDAHWQARELFNNYNMRQDRFSLLEPVSSAGTLRDYETHTCGTHAFTVLPTPGHTVGSLTLLAELDGQRVAFTGDLIAAPGKVWSLAATQWSYNGAEGVAASIASLLSLQGQGAALLLPAHGEPMRDPGAAIALLVERLWALLRARAQNLRLFELHAEPFVALSPHLLWNRTCMAYGYVLLSETGQALVIDYGYDFMVGLAAGADRAARRPWLYTLAALRQQFGVQRIEVALPTHYHDDHVAGFNLLRTVEGTEVWAAESFADVLAAPARYDLPCLWYDPIPVDRVLPLEQPFAWHEYELTLHALPGHTRYAVAIAFEVDGQQVLATGDQYQEGDQWNYVYGNRFTIGDYRQSAALYRQVNPDLILSGHWEPRAGTAALLDTLDARGEQLEALHRALLPLEAVDFGADSTAARIQPYQCEVRGGQPIPFEVKLRNPLPHGAEVRVQVHVPAGWDVSGAEGRLHLDAHATGLWHFAATPPPHPTRRARIAVDLAIGGQRLGQQAEALVTVLA